MSENKSCIYALGIYLGSLTVVSAVGMIYGYPEALGVWVLPFLTGFKCPGEQEVE